MYQATFSFCHARGRMCELMSSILEASSPSKLQGKLIKQAFQNGSPGFIGIVTPHNFLVANFLSQLVCIIQVVKGILGQKGLQRGKKRIIVNILLAILRHPTNVLPTLYQHSNDILLTL